MMRLFMLKTSFDEIHSEIKATEQYFDKKTALEFKNAKNT